MTGMRASWQHRRRVPIRTLWIILDVWLVAFVTFEGLRGDLNTDGLAHRRSRARLRCRPLGEAMTDMRATERPSDTTTVPTRRPDESATEYYDLLRELVDIHESFGCRGCNQCSGCRAILGMQR